MLEYQLDAADLTMQSQAEARRFTDPDLSSVDIEGRRPDHGVQTLVEAAQARWRAVNTPHVVALVRAGACFERGKLVERIYREAA